MKVSLPVLTNLEPPPVATDSTVLRKCIDCIDGALDRHGLAGAPLLLAVSGGGDSMAMAYAFSRWQVEQASPPDMRAVPLRAVIVNHGLRDEAAEEAAAVQARLDKIGIPARIKTITTPAPVSGIQAALRRGRYGLLADEAAQDDAVIMTAHHADDQAETVAMRNARGSGIDGLGGMREFSVMRGVRVLRPFLGLRRNQLRAALDGSGITVADDPSNRDRRFERVRVRHTISHATDDEMTTPLLRLASAAASISDSLTHAIADTMRGKTAIAPEGWGWCDHAAYAALPEVARGHLLARLHRGVMPSCGPVKRKAIMRLDEALLDGKAATLGGCEWRFMNGRIVAYPEAERLPCAMPLDGSHDSVMFDNRWRVLCLANITGSLEPLGGSRAAALRREGDFKGIPARALWRMPFIASASLENGGFIPHLIKDGTGARIRTKPTMYFTGARHFRLKGD